MDGQKSTIALELGGTIECILVTYVDDLMMIAYEECSDKLWAQLESELNFTEAAAMIKRHSGAQHEITYDKENQETTMIVEMRDYLDEAMANYSNEAGLKALPFVATPYLEEHVPTGEDKPGNMSKNAASHLMKLFFAARMARPDELTAIALLARSVSKWSEANDRELHMLMCYTTHHLGG